MNPSYLVDTNVLSANSPARRRQAPGLADWLAGNGERLYLSVVTVAEIEDGVAKLRREGATRKAATIAEWLDALLHLHAKRVLPFDLEAARIAGRLSDRARGCGHAPGFADIAIAATAAAHGLALLTRNTRHFEPLGVEVLDPFKRLPG